MIALPVTGGFLYVESIYIQAAEARMPQLKKVVLAMGDRLIYRDTFDEALADLTGASSPSKPAVAAVNNAAPENLPPAATDLRALAGRLHQLQQQAEQLAQELAGLEKDAEKK